MKFEPHRLYWALLTYDEYFDIVRMGRLDTLKRVAKEQGFENAEDVEGIYISSCCRVGEMFELVFIPQLKEEGQNG